jgi:GNAT superfamily N-acetyltransferase
MVDFNEHEFELQGPGFELRSAGADDGDLVRRIVGLASHWRILDVPHTLSAEVDKYHVDWGRPGDVGVFAFRGVEFVGGATVRSFSPADGAYGYVDLAFPELTIGVEADYRRRGLAVLLLAALKAKVLEQGRAGISLSVEPDNGARHLYAKMGFDLVEDRGDDLLMLWQRAGSGR